jgi:mannitol/fructose-specific phosphotransferase system IIA component (Ntr-type)
MMLLNKVFDKSSIKLNLESKTKEAVFTELVEEIVRVHPELNREAVLAGIWDRENKMNTSVAPGVALPHGYYSEEVPYPVDIAGAIGISPDGIDYGAPDQNPVHFIFLIVMGEKSREKHLRVLSRILTLIDSGILTGIQAAGNYRSRQEVYDILARFN